MKIHIVKEGDTLYKLSQKYGVDLEKLKEANPQLQDPNQLDIGMKIKIPSQPKHVTTKKLLDEKKELLQEKPVAPVKEEVKPKAEPEDVKEKLEVKPDVTEKVKEKVLEKVKEEIKDKKKETVKKDDKIEVKEEKVNSEAKDLFKQIHIPSVEVGSFYDLPKIPDLEEEIPKKKTADAAVKSEYPGIDAEGIAANQMTLPQLQETYHPAYKEQKPPSQQPFQTNQPYLASVIQGSPYTSGLSYDVQAASSKVSAYPGANLAALPNAGHSWPSYLWPTAANVSAQPNMMYAGAGCSPYMMGHSAAAYPNLQPMMAVPNASPYSAVSHGMHANMAFPNSPHASNPWGGAGAAGMPVPGFPPVPPTAGIPSVPMPGIPPAPPMRHANSPCGCQERSLPIPWYSVDQANASTEAKVEEPEKATVKKSSTKKKEEKPAVKVKSTVKKKTTAHKSNLPETKKGNNPWLNT